MASNNVFIAIKPLQSETHSNLNGTLKRVSKSYQKGIDKHRRLTTCLQLKEAVELIMSLAIRNIHPTKRGTQQRPWQTGGWKRIAIIGIKTYKQSSPSAINGLEDSNEFGIFKT